MGSETECLGHFDVLSLWIPVQVCVGHNESAIAVADIEHHHHHRVVARVNIHIELVRPIVVIGSKI